MNQTIYDNDRQIMLHNTILFTSTTTFVIFLCTYNILFYYNKKNINLFRSITPLTHYSRVEKNQPINLFPLLYKYLKTRLCCYCLFFFKKDLPSSSHHNHSTMREDNPNWFLKWEEDLPSPEELIPISQTLITPHLALAFQIQTPNNLKPNKTIITPPPPPPPQMMMSSDFGGDSGGSGDEPARTLKRPRLVWTPQLHKRFVDAVGHLGIKNAVPKTIMQLMSVEGLTRENVASHLQKYRLYLRRMQGGGGNNGHGFVGGGGGHVLVSDSATDRLFASSPVPAHFLSPVGVNSDYLMNPYMAKNVIAQQNQVVRNLRYDDSEFGNGVYGDGGRKILKLFPSGN